MKYGKEEFVNILKQNQQQTKELDSLLKKIDSLTSVVKQIAQKNGAKMNIMNIGN